MIHLLLITEEMVFFLCFLILRSFPQFKRAKKDATVRGIGFIPPPPPNLSGAFAGLKPEPLLCKADTNWPHLNAFKASFP